MSICLTWFPIGVLGEPYLYQNLGYFTRIGDFTWRVSDFEELVDVEKLIMFVLTVSGIYLLISVL